MLGSTNVQSFPSDSQVLAQRFQSAHARLLTAAVTGTNGKTSTTTLIDSIVSASGEPSARLTTIGGWVDGEAVVADNATHQFLTVVERAVESGVRTLALEMTSKALSGGLARRWPPTVAVFTNLTRDHLDMHGTPEAYLASKAQLFMALGPGGCAILNADDSSSDLIRKVIPQGVSVRGFSMRPDQPATLVAESVTCSARGIRIQFAPSPLADELGRHLELSIVGGIHAQNVLAAILAADALGYKPPAILQGLKQFQGVAGRFQVISHEPVVAVDYAHTPDGLQGTLKTAREIAQAAEHGKVFCVFGCGGERDRGKRPQMGAIADALADVVVLTSDNPRCEDPASIARDIQSGAPSPRALWKVELDRAQAIEWAIHQADAQDVVIIAGKGHEQEQEIQDTRIPFSDVEVAQVALTRTLSPPAPGKAGASPDQKPATCPAQMLD